MHPWSSFCTALKVMKESISLTTNDNINHQRLSGLIMMNVSRGVKSVKIIWLIIVASFFVVAFAGSSWRDEKEVLDLAATETRRGLGQGRKSLRF